MSTRGICGSLAKGAREMKSVRPCVGECVDAYSCCRPSIYIDAMLNGHVNRSEKAGQERKPTVPNARQ